MKVCDVVLNSIWFDPRVRKQIISYQQSRAETVCVGYRCNRYDEQKVSALPCKATIIDIGDKYRRKLPSIRLKLKRMRLKDRLLYEAIIAEHPDVIHANDLDVLLASYRASRKLKCVLVYDSHEINIENNEYMNMPEMQKKAIRMVEKFIMKRTSVNVCTNHSAASYFAEKYHILPPMIVTNCSLKKDMDFSKKEKHTGFEVLNHGQFYAGRGYDIMVEAAALLSDCDDAVIALRGFGAMEEQLRSRAAELEAENVVFYPPVRVEELIREASASHVGVAITEPICLNFKYSVSNKLFEYASAGLPVIMSDIPEHRYLNERYQFGLIIPQNTPQAFAEAVRCFYRDRDLYEQCAENARKLAEKVNWDNEFGELVSREKMIMKQ